MALSLGAMGWFVIAVFPDHTHLLFIMLQQLFSHYGLGVDNVPLAV